MEKTPLPNGAAAERDASLKLDRLARLKAANVLRRYSRCVPPLRPDDAVGLTILFMVEWWLRRIHPRGCRFDKSILNLCSRLAFEYGIYSHAGFATAAGVLPRIIWTREHQWRHAEVWLNSWLEERHAAMDMMDSCLDGVVAGDPRQLLLTRLERLIKRPIPLKRLIDPVRKGVQRAEEEWGRRMSTEDQEPANLAGTFLVAIHGPKGVTPLLFVDSSGAIGISDGAVRDFLGPRGRGKAGTVPLSQCH